MANIVTPTEIGYLQGGTSNVQAQINSILTGSGGANTVSNTLSAAFSTSSATYVDTGLSVSFTVTNTNDPILVTFSGWFSVDVSGTPRVALLFDSGTAEMIWSMGGLSGGRWNGCFSKVYTNLASGSHTVKLQMSNTGAAGSHTLQYHAIDNEVPTLSVTRFR